MSLLLLERRWAKIRGSLRSGNPHACQCNICVGLKSISSILQPQGGIVRTKEITESLVEWLLHNQGFSGCSSKVW